MAQSEQIGELAAALSKAQAQMAHATKDAENPFFKSKYADLENVINAVKGPLSSNGLSYVQTIEDDIYLVTQLMHSSGQWLNSKLKMVISKNDMQSLGASITYGRRFALSALIGLSQTDRDGEDSSFRMTVVELNRLKELNELAGHTYEALLQRLKSKLNIEDPLYLQKEDYYIVCERLQKEAKEKKIK